MASSAETAGNKAHSSKASRACSSNRKASFCTGQYSRRHGHQPCAFAPSEAPVTCPQALTSPSAWLPCCQVWPQRLSQVQSKWPSQETDCQQLKTITEVHWHTRMSLHSLQITCTVTSGLADTACPIQPLLLSIAATADYNAYTTAMCPPLCKASHLCLCDCSPLSWLPASLPSQLSKGCSIW